MESYLNKKQLREVFKMKKTNILVASTMSFSLLLSGLSATSSTTSETTSITAGSEMHRHITKVSAPVKKIQTLYISNVRANAGTKYKVIASAKKEKFLLRMLQKSRFYNLA